MRLNYLLRSSILATGLWVAASSAPQNKTEPKSGDRLAGYLNVAEAKKKTWQLLDGQLTQLLDAQNLCENFADIKDKLKQVLDASDVRIEARKTYYKENEIHHARLLKAAVDEIAGAENREKHIRELWDLDDKYLDELKRRRADLFEGMKVAGKPTATKGADALKTLDELIAGTLNRQKIRETTTVDLGDLRTYNKELQIQTSLLMELATKHRKTVELEGEMWKTYYKARESRVLLSCGPNREMKAPQTEFPHKRK